MIKKKINKDILYGSWAGAFGNFQFMPSTISNYAIDYNQNDFNNWTPSVSSTSGEVILGSGNSIRTAARSRNNIIILTFDIQ